MITRLLLFMNSKPSPPVCDYEGSDYQTAFWDQGGREYEDRTEAIALNRLLPDRGRLILELGAGAGRNTLRLAGFEHVVLLDYSLTQLQQARKRLGPSDRFTYVAGDIYRLPFIDDLFDSATMIRTLHHMVNAPRALGQVGNVLQPGATFVLEFANKRNLKSILRYWLGIQDWNPFTQEPVEFVELNFDFHPKMVKSWLKEVGFSIETILTVSHFRIDFLKRIIPLKILIALDSALQWTGPLWQLTPSVFLRASRKGQPDRLNPESRLEWFKCLSCGSIPLSQKKDRLRCSSCKTEWAIIDGIYDFREPLSPGMA